MAREPVIKQHQIPSSKNGTTASPPAKTHADRGGDSGFNPDDDILDEELRPQRLVEIIGQRKVIDRVRIMLDAAKMRGEALGHLLLDGPPGIGKTTIATVIPRELSSDFQMTSGPALRAPKDLLPYLTRATEKSVLFIDEIHRLPPAVEEFLYPAMEDFRVDIALGDGLSARTINMKLKPFTVVGATTRSGMLTAPLRDRFVNRAHLDFYDNDDLITIITRNAKKLRTDIDADAARELAIRSRGTPRKSNNLLRWSRDFVQVQNDNSPITNALAVDALRMLEIDHLGLEEQDRKYLRTLIEIFTGGPAGIQAIAHSMNISADTLEDEVEPFLLRCGFVQRTPRGRVVTAAACEHLGISFSAEQNGLQNRLFG